jgi:ribosomal protein S18 acetylase RimI-like enzyme
MRAETGRAASRSERFAAGVAYLTDELPLVWDLNCAWLDAAPGEDGPRLPKYLFADERIAPALGGWSLQRIVVLAWRADPPQRVPGVERADPDVQAPVQTAINREAGLDDATTEQLDAANRLREERTGKRSYGRMLDGRAVALADLYSDGEVAQVEDVATLPGHRRRGHGSEVVLHAVAEAAGHELIFLVAGEARVPWYESLGFTVAGSYFEATRSL